MRRAIFPDIIRDDGNRSSYMVLKETYPTKKEVVKAFESRCGLIVTNVSIVDGVVRRLSKAEAKELYEFYREEEYEGQDYYS